MFEETLIGGSWEMSEKRKKKKKKRKAMSLTTTRCELKAIPFNVTPPPH